MAINGKTLDISTLESWLWEAACVIRGPVDAPKFPEPEFREEAGGFRVVFLKDPFTPERLRALGLNER
jgi:hypothetical protein